MSETRALRLETDEDIYQSGDEITVEVWDERGVPVAGAVVRFPDGGEVVTDADGTATVVADTTGILRLQATRENDDGVSYTPDEHLIRVRQA
ncbi:hypothetical protein [Haloglomus halophilum]|uniref:hypothetical protein n=1 Tax=Haloglomus halophilum TaxID=2962672 RepID=UPI0020C9436C|nr:hypothetical protein [Haloglomus halophilum]